MPETHGGKIYTFTYTHEPQGRQGVWIPASAVGLDFWFTDDDDDLVDYSKLRPIDD